MDEEEIKKIKNIFQWFEFYFLGRCPYRKTCPHYRKYTCCPCPGSYCGTFRNLS